MSSAGEEGLSVKRSVQARLSLAVAAISAALAVPALAPAASLNVYRFYNNRAGTHFYTASDQERADVILKQSATYSYEGTAYTLEAGSPSATQPLHRFYNTVTGTHFYTASDDEKAAVLARLSAVYRYEGTAYNVSAVPVAGGAAVYRFRNLRTGVHFYTASAGERDAVIAQLSGTYALEGTAFYVPLAPPAPVPDAMALEQASADAILAGLKATYPRFLTGVTVSMGTTPNGYQAVCYYREGSIVVSPTHTASMEQILSHEIWHVIDWRDNGCIDWRESIPPANAADFRG